MQKEIKRCIPKEGMPHAHKACQKKCKGQKDAYPKKVCHMLKKHVKKENKEKKRGKIAHAQRIKGRFGS